MGEVPRRIQLRRTKGWKLQEASVALNGLPCVKVDRTTEWGNPHTLADLRSIGVSGSPEMLRAVLVGQYREYLHPRSPLANMARRVLRGKNLGCWCPLPVPGEPDLCHAAVLLEIANAPGMQKP